MTNPVDLVRLAAGRFGQARAVEFPGGSMSFIGLDAQVAAVSAELRTLSGHRVALRAPLTVHDIVRFLALVRVGALVVLVSRVETSASLLELKSRWRIAVSMGQDGLPDAAGEEPAGVVIPTSGSTGVPKGVIHALNSLLASARGACGHLDFQVGDRWAVTLPMHHVGGLSVLFRSLVSGGTMFLPDDRRDLAAIAVHVTHLSLVPTQLRRLLEACPEGPPGNLKRVLLGGGPVPSALADQAVSSGWPLVMSYGLSEMGSLVTATDVGELGSAGRVLPERELRISEIGEIEVGGQALFVGYLDQPPASAWHATGDLGYLDGAGCLHVMGRRDNMFISGGENIYPERIEAALMEARGVEDVVVVPVPDTDFGARPVAFFKGRMTADELDRSVRRVLPGFMAPVAYHPLPESFELKHSRIELARLAEGLPRTSI